MMWWEVKWAEQVDHFDDGVESFLSQQPLVKGRVNKPDEVMQQNKQLIDLV